MKRLLLGMTFIFGVAFFAAPTMIVTSSEASVIGGRPAGCPARYCGCAVAGKVGLRGAKWNTNLAANYVRNLPRASCAPGMVAARSGHVFVIQACHGNGSVTAWDPNSGGGKTRIHTRSLAGYTVVNPRGGSRSTMVAWWEPFPSRALDRKPVHRYKKKVRHHYARAAPARHASAVRRR